MNETEQINYLLLERARVIIFAAYGAPVEVLKPSGWYPIESPTFVGSTYRISPDWLNVPEGYELVPLGEKTGREIAARFPGHPLWEHNEGPSFVASNPKVIVARPITEPEPRKVDLTKDDWDGHPVWWVRRANRVLEPECTEFMVTEIHPSGTIRRADNRQFSPQELSEHFERSHDRREWTPCYKLEDPS